MDVATSASRKNLSSSAIRDFVHVPGPDRDPAGFVSGLRALILRGEHDMVIPADDQSLLALSEHHDELDRVTYLACPPSHITSLVLNKWSTLEMAAACGIHTPKTRLISESAQLPGLVTKVPFPWILKPARKKLRVEEVKSLLLKNSEDLARKFPRPLRFNPPMLLQDYCSGDGVGIEVLMHRGDCVCVFQHRRLKEYPYTGGFSVTAVAERPDSRLVEQSVELLRAMGWDGPAMVEFRVNHQNGDAVLMEVNGRYWGSISLPILAGVDFPFYHWQLIHGQQPNVPKEYAAGLAWRWTSGHILRANGLLIAARRSVSARHELLQNFFELGGLFDSSVRDAMFTDSDPMPAIFDLFETVQFLTVDNIRVLFNYFSCKGRDRIRKETLPASRRALLG